MKRSVLWLTADVEINRGVGVDDDHQVQMRETEIFFLQRVEIENETMIKLEKKNEGSLFSLIQCSTTKNVLQTREESR